jgi:hypothetical protein
MNCQPSFARGSVPLGSTALDEFGLLPPAAQDGILAKATDRVPAGPEGRKPHRRVPDCDIIDVGRRPRPPWRDEPVDVLDLVVSQGEGAVRLPGPGASVARRHYTKALVALLILQVTALSGFYLKKRYAETQVIVIPATVNERAVIT